MMELSRIQLVVWVLSILCLACFSDGFTPVDNYLIDCGSNSNATVGGRVFVSESHASRFLATPREIFANTSKSVTSSDDSQLYETARILDGTSIYSFSIGKSGRHWIRLYFYPFVYESYNMSKANFSVSAQNFVFLSDFGVTTNVIKEFSVNVTSDTLVITFTPVNNSFAFLNALEVVSVPDEIVTDDADTYSPNGRFQGLPWQALETVARVNMGGPTVSSENDTLWRTWVPDQSFIVQANLAANVSNIRAVNYVQGGATPDIAPNTVYGTATKMNSADDPNSNFNVSWEFSVDPGFQYLVRFHFCDIVSQSLNQLYFNVYIDTYIVVRDLDLSSYLVNTLAAAYFADYVTPVTASNKLRVSIGPSTTVNVYPDAILNGLEILKMNDSMGSLSGAATISSATSSKKNVGAIVGGSIGAFIAVLFVGIIFTLCRKRRRLAHGPSKTSWIPLSVNGGNSPTTADSSVSVAQFEASSVDDLSGVSMSRVFSQLVKSEGR
ncbi:kinase family protein [Tripterygium wilfordii]|uniref:Kinase family protein n=1 Tax=Tripterygium wilfordii TaxID=458696 RepID=A0A7J7DEA1_TRIWF|nr:kinase family protein [Tripterygium wilfordii]